MKSKPAARQLIVRALACLVLIAPLIVVAQDAPAVARFNFRAGQTVYIVAYRRAQVPVATDSMEVSVIQRDVFYNDLDAEREVRKEIERWGFFKVAEKLSVADFILLVNIEGGSMEGLAVPAAAYQQHYKEKFDLDALRDAAHGRYLAGPLKLPTANRLSDRLVKNFRETLTKGVSTAR